MGDGSADFCLFGKLKIKGKRETSALRYGRRMEGNLHRVHKVYTCTVFFSS